MKSRSMQRRTTTLTTGALAAALLTSVIAGLSTRLVAEQPNITPTTPPHGPPSPPPPTPQDRVFAAVVEGWVATAAHPHYDPDRYLSPALRRLGAPHWREREEAMRALARDVRGHFRQLILAERSRDPEIAARAQWVLGEITRCRVAHRAMSEWECCNACGNTGDLRFEGWDDDGRRVPRDLFRVERPAVEVANDVRVD